MKFLRGEVNMSFEKFKQADRIKKVIILLFYLKWDAYIAEYSLCTIARFYKRKSWEKGSRPLCPSFFNYLPMSDLTPRYKSAMPKTIMAIPPTISKKLTIPALITVDSGIFASPKPAIIHAKYSKAC